MGVLDTSGISCIMYVPIRAFQRVQGASQQCRGFLPQGKVVKPTNEYCSRVILLACGRRSPQQVHASNHVIMSLIPHSALNVANPPNWNCPSRFADCCSTGARPAESRCAPCFPRLPCTIPQMVARHHPSAPGERAAHFVSRWRRHWIFWHSHRGVGTQRSEATEHTSFITNGEGPENYATMAAKSAGTWRRLWHFHPIRKQWPWRSELRFPFLCLLARL